MSLINRLFLVLLGVVLSTGLAWSEDSAPSVGAMSMPGATGVFEFKPVDWHSHELSWWKDSDGVAPGVAGCHIGVNADGTPNGRTFGEACLPDGRLVESNPEKGELHSHHNDVGFPDTFDCHEWCMGQSGTSGQCVVEAAPPCQVSARCLCDAQLSPGGKLIEATNRAR